MNKKFLSLVLAFVVTLTSVGLPIANSANFSLNQNSHISQLNNVGNEDNLKSSITNENKKATQNTLALFSFVLYSASVGISFPIKNNSSLSFENNYQTYVKGSQSKAKEISDRWKNFWVKLSDSNNFTTVLTNLYKHKNGDDDKNLVLEYQNSFNQLFGANGKTGILNVNKLISINSTGLDIPSKNNPFMSMSKDILMPTLNNAITNSGKSITNNILIDDILKVVTVYIATLALLDIGNKNDMTTLPKATPFLIAFLDISGISVNLSDITRIILSPTNLLAYLSYLLPWILNITNITYRGQGSFIEYFINNSKTLKEASSNSTQLSQDIASDAYEFGSFIWANNFKYYIDSTHKNLIGVGLLFHREFDNIYDVKNFTTYFEPYFSSIEQKKSSIEKTTPLSTSVGKLINYMFLNVKITNTKNQSESFLDAMGVDVFDYYAKNMNKNNPFSHQTGELKFKQDKYVFDQLSNLISFNNNPFDAFNNLTSVLSNINKSYSQYYQSQLVWFDSSEIQHSSLGSGSFEKTIAQLFNLINSNTSNSYNTVDDILATASMSKTLNLDFKNALTGKYAPYAHFNMNNPNYDPFTINSKNNLLLLEILVPSLLVLVISGSFLCYFFLRKKKLVKNNLTKSVIKNNITTSKNNTLTKSEKPNTFDKDHRSLF